jgi:hypothetical protein
MHMLSRAIGAKRRHAAWLSLTEITLLAFAKFQYRPHEREAHFQNTWEQLSICFSFTQSKCAEFYSRKMKLSSMLGRTATISVTFWSLRQM